MEPFLDADAIGRLNQSLATQITRDYKNIVTESSPLCLVVTLKGALFFASDLARLLSIPTELEFVRVSSYGSGSKSSGEVKILKDVEGSLFDKHLLILDEIVDSGHTISFLKRHLLGHKPKSLKVASLLSKPSRREVEVTIDYLGREVEDKFLIGYGLDFAEKHRSLPGIFSMNV